MKGNKEILMKLEKYLAREIIPKCLFMLWLIVLSCSSPAQDAVSIEVTRIKGTIYKLCVNNFVNMDRNHL